MPTNKNGMTPEEYYAYINNYSNQSPDDADEYTKSAKDDASKNRDASKATQKAIYDELVADSEADAAEQRARQKEVNKQTRDDVEKSRAAENYDDLNRIISDGDTARADTNEWLRSEGDFAENYNELVKLATGSEGYKNSLAAAEGDTARMAASGGNFFSGAARLEAYDKARNAMYQTAMEQILTSAAEHTNARLAALAGLTSAGTTAATTKSTNQTSRENNRLDSLTSANNTLASGYSTADSGQNTRKQQAGTDMADNTAQSDNTYATTTAGINDNAFAREQDAKAEALKATATGYANETSANASKSK